MVLAVAHGLKGLPAAWVPTIRHTAALGAVVPAKGVLVAAVAAAIPVVRVVVSQAAVARTTAVWTQSQRSESVRAMGR